MTSANKPYITVVYYCGCSRYPSNNENDKKKNREDQKKLWKNHIMNNIQAKVILKNNNHTAEKEH